MVHAQDFEVVRHQVQMGETVKMLSKRYKVEPSEIYRLNKFAIDGIRQGMVLQILVPKKETEIAIADTGSDDHGTVQTSDDQPGIEQQANEMDSQHGDADTVLEISHTVAKGETLYSLARKYKVPVDEIKTRNEQILKKGLQTGQVLTIRTTNP